MSESSTAGSGPAPSSQMRTLAVRISDDLRAQLDVIAQLSRGRPCLIPDGALSG